MALPRKFPGRRHRIRQPARHRPGGDRARFAGAGVGNDAAAHGGAGHRTGRQARRRHRYRVADTRRRRRVVSGRSHQRPVGRGPHRSHRSASPPPDPGHRPASRIETAKAHPCRRCGHRQPLRRRRLFPRLRPMLAAGAAGDRARTGQCPADSREPAGTRRLPAGPPGNRHPPGQPAGHLTGEHAPVSLAGAHGGEGPSRSPTCSSSTRASSRTRSSASPPTPTMDNACRPTRPPARSSARPASNCCGRTSTRSSPGSAAAPTSARWRHCAPTRHSTCRPS